MEGGGSNGSTCFTMGFGESGSGLCPMTMMMPMPLPLVTSHHVVHDHHPQHPNIHNPNLNNHNNGDMDNFFDQLPSSNKHDHNNLNSTGRTTFTLDYSHENNNNNHNCGTGLASSFLKNNNDSNGCSSSSVKAKIMVHPQFHGLLAAYASCQKVGAPPEVVARLEEVCSSMSGQVSTGYLGEDPVLDQFMEAYSEMLLKYEQELSKPFKEAMQFLQRIECQFKALTISSFDSACHEAMDGAVGDGVDVQSNLMDPQVEDHELKTQLLRKYSGYLGSLKQEFMKKRKKEKLPKEARQQLLDWWSRHYKWPYPSESQKLALAESTGLDHKQINNWFINQRKRHWKPSEDMQFVVMDAAHPHYSMNNVLGNPFPMDLSSALM